MYYGKSMASALAGLLLLTMTACGGSSSAPADNGGGGGAGAANPPVADSFSWPGNTRLTVFAANGLLANDPAGTEITAADTTTALGGTVTVDTASGAFVYEPPVGAENISDFFSYTAAGFAPVSVTIDLTERIWYVKNDAAPAGQGTFTAPFTTLLQAETAANANDTIFVYASALGDIGQNQGIVLQTGQKLIGEGVGLTVNGIPLVDAFPNAVISNGGLAAPGNSPVVMLSAGGDNEVAGFDIFADFNEGILAVGGSGNDIHDNSITPDPTNGREGIRLLNISGTNRILRNTIHAAPRDAIKVANNEDAAGDPAAAVPVTGTLAMAANMISNPLRDGIRVDLDGAGTTVGLHLLTNSVSGSGTGAGDEGINLNMLGAASASAVLSRNTISGSGDEAIDLQVGGTANLAAFVANNDLSASAAPEDFRGSVADTSIASACLELLNNGNTTGTSTFSVENTATGSGTVELFDAGNNDTPVATVGSVSPVLQGACGITLDGGLLFEANCGTCHVGNGLGNGNVGPNLTNATAAMIDFQLSNNPTMSFISLTPVEIDAIETALATGP